MVPLYRNVMVPLYRNVMVPLYRNVMVPNPSPALWAGEQNPNRTINIDAHDGASHLGDISVYY